MAKGAWPHRGYLNLARRGSLAQSAQRGGRCGFGRCARSLRYFFFSKLINPPDFFPWGPASCDSLPSPTPSSASPLKGFVRARSRTGGGGLGAPSLPALGRGLAALPSGCVPAAPGGRRPGLGSAASEDLPPPGTQPRAAAASSSSSSFPAGAPAPRASGMDEKYLPELMAEKDSLDPSFTHALRLVNQGEGRRGGGPCRAARTFRRGSPLTSVASHAASSRGGFGDPPHPALLGVYGVGGSRW